MQGIAGRLLLGLTILVTPLWFADHVGVLAKPDPAVDGIFTLLVGFLIAAATSQAIRRRDDK